MGRRILVVTYAYPPMPTIGSRRWESMTRHLRELGHEVRLVTTGAFGSLHSDGDEVVRTGDLIASPHLRRLLRRPPLVAAEGPVAANSPAPAPMMRIAVPDPYLLSWVPLAVPVLWRQVGEWHPDCVISTSPYESGHLVPFALGRRRPAWIVDLRDGWCFEPHRPPFYIGLQRWLDRFLEARVLRGADGVIAATKPIADDAERRLGVHCAYVPNGWDPLVEDSLKDERHSLVAKGRVTVAYTGTLTGTGGRDPSGLLAALRLLLDEDPEIATRFELVIAGQPGPDDDRLIAAAEVGSLVRHVGRLPRAGALRLQRDADAVLLLTSAAGSEATGKLFEYLSSGSPIVALTGRSEAARIVEETRTGIVASPSAPDAIADALRAVIRGEVAGLYAPTGLERYVYPEPARTVVEEVERAVRLAEARRAS